MAARLNVGAAQKKGGSTCSWCHDQPSPLVGHLPSVQSAWSEALFAKDPPAEAGRVFRAGDLFGVGDLGGWWGRFERYTIVHMEDNVPRHLTCRACTPPGLASAMVVKLGTHLLPLAQSVNIKKHFDNP